MKDLVTAIGLCLVWAVIGAAVATLILSRTGHLCP